jgi:hypothetical protein
MIYKQKYFYHLLNDLRLDQDRNRTFYKIINTNFVHIWSLYKMIINYKNTIKCFQILLGRKLFLIIMIFYIILFLFLL